MANLKVNPEKYNDNHNNKHGVRQGYKKHNYSNEEATENLINYCLDKEKMINDVFYSYGAPNVRNPAVIAAAYKYVRKYYGQEHDRRMNHFVISFQKEEADELGLEGMQEVVETFVEPIVEDYQLLYAFHEHNPEKIHAHIIFNHTSYTTGLRHHRSNGFAIREKQRLDDTLESVLEKKRRK